MLPAARVGSCHWRTRKATQQHSFSSKFSLCCRLQNSATSSRSQVRWDSSCVRVEMLSDAVHCRKSTNVVADIFAAVSCSNLHCRPPHCNCLTRRSSPTCAIQAAFYVSICRLYKHKILRTCDFINCTVKNHKSSKNLRAVVSVFSALLPTEKIKPNYYEVLRRDNS